MNKTEKFMLVFLVISVSCSFVHLVSGRSVTSARRTEEAVHGDHDHHLPTGNNEPKLRFETETDEDDDADNINDSSNDGEEVDQQKDLYELYLDSAHDILMLWNVDYRAGHVIVEIRAKTPIGQAVAIGFSDYGEVASADFCVLWFDIWSNAHFEDTWSDSEGKLHLDKKQDCRLMQLSRNDDGVVYTFRRSFDTCDPKDFILDVTLKRIKARDFQTFQFGTIHVMYAIMKGPMDKLPGTCILDGPHGFQRTQMLKPETHPAKFPKHTKTFSVLAKETRVPSDETTYWCRLVQLPSMDKKRHVVQFEAVIQPGHETLVHHMEVFHCETQKGRKLPYYSGPCMGPERPPELEPCRKVIAAWAMGAPPLTYPAEAGLPIGGPSFAEYVVLEIHYNNEEKKGDYVDSSGVRFHYTSNMRTYDAGVVEVGLEYTPKMAIPPRQPAFILSGHCIVQCTEVGLSPNGVVLFAAQLHTHLTGRQVVVRHYRGGEEMAEVARDNHYSPHYQEIRHLRKSTLVLPGDALVTSCTYNTMDRENITLGGYAIRDEMCVSYIHYYPKSELEVCKSSIDSDILQDYFRFLNEYEEQPTLDKNDVSENYRAINWTPLRADMLHTLYDDAPLSMQCNRSSGDRFPGYWNNAPQTKVLRPLRKSPRICSDESAEYIVTETED